jgi:hypothetical protein
MKRPSIHASLATGRIWIRSPTPEFVQDDSPLVWASYKYPKNEVRIRNPLPSVVTLPPRRLISRL